MQREETHERRLARSRVAQDDNTPMLANGLWPIHTLGLLFGSAPTRCQRTLLQLLSDLLLPAIAGPDSDICKWAGIQLPFCSQRDEHFVELHRHLPNGLPDAPMIHFGISTDQIIEVGGSGFASCVVAKILQPGGDPSRQLVRRRELAVNPIRADRIAKRLLLLVLVRRDGFHQAVWDGKLIRAGEDQAPFPQLHGRFIFQVGVGFFAAERAAPINRPQKQDEQIAFGHLIGAEFLGGRVARAEVLHGDAVAIVDPIEQLNGAFAVGDKIAGGRTEENFHGDRTPSSEENGKLLNDEACRIAIDAKQATAESLSPVSRA
ncbi:MAG: hypothetical protein SF339_13755 [Blastocatellia bacterium]|nr:hypothetical protein [Blastocatellia bacterium]